MTYGIYKRSKMMMNICFLILISASLNVAAAANETDTTDSRSEIEYGKQLLYSTLKEAGIKGYSDNINVEVNPKMIPAEDRISQGYSVSVDNKIDISGYDAAGALYGCIDLAGRIKNEGSLPAKLYFADKPEMKLRGVCMFLMKLGTYNYQLTPESFPFFFNKKLWIEYLNFLAANKYNYIAFWNGHPFDYFVKLEKYPEAQSSVTSDMLKQNHDMLKWLIREGAKRNIKFFFEFYNIHTSIDFRKAHNLPGEISIPSKLLADYTSYCIQKFVRAFPEVGLYITAGEALDQKYSVSWVNDVILSAIKETGYNPPVFLRTWCLSLANGKKIVPNYSDLYIESKYNIEMIADTLIDPENKEWAALNGNFIVNIHMEGNLEPFRWNPPLYIQKCVRSSVEAGANGIHLYPRKPWRWPYGNEVGLKEYQWQRDALWYIMWGRYGWNSRRNPESELKYWRNYLTKKLGSTDAASHLLKAFEVGADVLPALQRLIWAGFDNHTVLTSGLMLTQIEKAGGIPFLHLKPVQRIPEFLSDISSGIKTNKTSPVDFLKGKLQAAVQSYKEIIAALKYSVKDKDEVKRYKIDAEAVELTAKFYYEKLHAAVYYTMYKSGIDSADNSEKCLTELKKSVDTYSDLTKLTDGYYDSISDVPASHPIPLKKVPYHWKDILPLYEKEYQIYSDDINHRGNKSDNQPAYAGLTGVLFGDPGLVKPKRIIKAESLDFDWNLNPPDDGRNWSILFEGFIKAPATGEVKFYARSEQGALLTIGGKKIMNKSQSQKEETCVFKMFKDKWYPVTVEYENEDFKGANLTIKWSWQEGKFETICKSFLKHSAYNNYRAERTITLGF